MDEASPLVTDHADAYAVTKRDTDAALAEVEGLTRVLLRPPAILGHGESSIWNSVRPAVIRDDEKVRHTVPGKSFAWFMSTTSEPSPRTWHRAERRRRRTPGADRSRARAPVVNVAAGPAQARDYYETVTGALGVEPVWDDAPAWTGRILAGRAHGWGWAPTVDLAQALAEIDRGLRA